jgi:hypothetical protein
MIKKIPIFCGAALVMAGAVAETTIDSSKSAFHVGESVMMCGVVSEVTKFSKGTYLNFGAKYPRQHIAVVVWDSDESKFNERFGGLGVFEGRQACARGMISEFRSALQLKVNNPQFLRLMK